MYAYKKVYTGMTLLNAYKPLQQQHRRSINCAMPYEDPFALFAARKERREHERLALRKRLAELDAEATDDQIAVQQLHKAYGNEGRSPLEPPPPSVPTPTSPMVMAQERGKGMSNKEVILAVLRNGGPGGLSAAQIKAKALLTYGRDLNSNTLTVTLVRASKEPAMTRCEGRQWYYVRQDEATNLRGALAPELALGGAPKARHQWDE